MNKAIPEKNPVLVKFYSSFLTSRALLGASSIEMQNRIEI